MNQQRPRGRQRFGRDSGTLSKGPGGSYLTGGTGPAAGGTGPSRDVTGELPGAGLAASQGQVRDAPGKAQPPYSITLNLEVGSFKPIVKTMKQSAAIQRAEN